MGTPSLDSREFLAGLVRTRGPVSPLSSAIAIFSLTEMQNQGAGTHSSKPESDRLAVLEITSYLREKRGGKESSVPWQKFGYPEAKGHRVTKPGFLQIQQALDGARLRWLPPPSTEYASGRPQRPGYTSWTLSPPGCSSLRVGSGWCTQVGPSCCWGCVRVAWRAH